LGRYSAFLFVLTMVAPVAGCGPAPLRVSPEVLAAATPDVLSRVRASPYNYFRLTNREWTGRVCETFAADLPSLPVVQLHGDAHVEQFAFTNDAWGLDDFDDAARGAALVDVVRFLGSIDLAARDRSWSRERQHLFDRFFDGYRKGLTDAAYQPRQPDVVRREKAKSPALSHDAFLAWAETQMAPTAPETMSSVVAGMKVFSNFVRSKHPDFTESYFRVVRAGWLRIGVGSAGMPKVLIRVDGPSTDSADDVLLEAKAVRARDSLPCIEQPTSTPSLRIVEGSQQVGRLKYTILVAGPELAISEETRSGQHLRDWWIRNWDSSYHEIGLRDLQSVADLAEIAYDAGVQLGAGTLRGVAAPDVATLRARQMTWIDQNEVRLRRTAERLVEEVVAGWHDIDGQISRASTRK
jgi:hypothetical protein